MQDWTIKKWVALHAILIGALFLIACQLFSIHRPLKISVLDVGQGDSILIQTTQYHNILIDAGADSKVVDQLSKQIAFFDKTIDIFILTHPHADHYGGILDVMQKYHIKKIILTGVVSKDPVYLAFLDEIKRKKTEIVFAQSNQDIQIGSNLYLDILYPFTGQSLVGQDVNNKNNTSIVARLLRETSTGWENLVMLTGDAEAEEEREIFLSGQDVRSNILKLGHHGSKTATSDVFLKAVDPHTAIVSAGKDNTFGHPHAETMSKLGNMTIYQTMTDGNVELYP